MELLYCICFVVLCAWVTGHTATNVFADSGSRSLKDDCLNAHNKYRARHEDTPSMEWSNELANGAQKWADELARRGGGPQRSPARKRKGEGENIAASKGKDMTGSRATDMWYGEIRYFDFDDKVFNHMTGHFTQVVWKASTKLGAAIATSKDGWHYCVARYSPPGNIKGLFDINIGNLISMSQDGKTMDKLREDERYHPRDSGHSSTTTNVLADSDSRSVKNDFLNAHNNDRARHEDTPNMEWSKELADQAQKWANELASRIGRPLRSPPGLRRGQGENIAASKGKPMTGISATKQWYGEIRYFDFENKVSSHKTSQFTQVIWKASTKLGAAIATSKDGWNYAVARYFPGGNLAGCYEQNIGNLKK